MRQPLPRPDAVTTLAERAGLAGAARASAIEAVLARAREAGLAQVRIAWGDLHGTFRGKTVVLEGVDARTLRGAFDEGIGLVSTILLKDTSDRTAFKVFDPEAPVALPGFRGANNLFLLPDPASFVVLPWTKEGAGEHSPARTGWLRAEPFFPDGSEVAIDPRRALQRALAALAGEGFGLVCGLEVEFHIWRIEDDALAAAEAAWPAEPPAVRLLHPGYNLLAENWTDLAHEALALVRDNALALGLPLRSLEVELGPSQFEAVFGVTDALTAADQVLLFRNGIRQALRRAGYHVSFVCRPPLPNAIASGWHLHHSLTSLADGGNAFRREGRAGREYGEGGEGGVGGEGRAPRADAGADARSARQVLSDTGAHWLAGLLAHARGMAALCAPTLPAYSRYQGSVMAPQAALWGRDNRGAMLRVLGEPGEAATRIENRLGEPMANPYLYIAAQVLAGLDGLSRRLEPPPGTETPYAAAPVMLPTSLGEALDALAADEVMQQGLGAPLALLIETVKQQELTRHAAAEDRQAWLRREYFGRY
ncbi:MAG: glutamine synthetase [Rubrivivax sp.]|nr:glutamine synthetase [Rubrivivax sp.]